MTGIADLPVCVCPHPDCRNVWVYDDKMYDDMDICPKCGRVAIPPWEGKRDPLEDIVSNQGSPDYQILYTQTGGPLLARPIANRTDFIRVRGY